MPVFECSRCNEMTYSAYAGVPRECASCHGATLRVIDGAFAEARRLPRDLGPCDHAGLVFDEPGAAAPFCARYVTDGVEAGEHVLAALPAELDESVRGLLAPDITEAVDWRATPDTHGDFDADRAAVSYREMIESDPRATRLVAGLGSTDDIEAGDFDRFERVAHEIVTALGVTAICVYDSRILSPEFMEIAARRHPLAVADGAVRRNEQFEYVPA